MTTFTNKYGLPDFISSALTREYYDKEHNTLSVTNLISSPKYVLLHKRHHDEIEVDISEQVWKIFGSAVHVVFDEAAEGAGIGEREERLFAEVDGIKISGKFDILDDKTITDYKVTSVWSVIFNDQSKWTKQLNVYKWLCDKNNRPVDKLQVAVIFRDWRRGESEKNQDYPKIPIGVYQIGIVDEKETEEYIKERIKLFKEAMELSDDEIPICTPEDRWKSEDTFAVYKNANKTALRVFNKLEEAENLVKNMTQQYPKNSFSIQTRLGVDKRCRDYCSAHMYCNHWKEKYKELTS